MMLVTYNQKTNTLIIQTKFHENDFPRQLPNRKFDGRLKVWIAPCIRFNAQLIKDKWYKISTIKITDEAKQAIEDTLRGFSNLKREPFPENYSFKMAPREYQKKALDYTRSLRVCAYYMAMGSGKSKTVIDKMVCNFLEGNVQALLIVCPCSIRHVWLTQFEEHCPIPYEIEIAELKDRKNIRDVGQFIELKTDKLKVLVVGVESLQLASGKAVDACTRYMQKNNAGVVVDEAHDIKNADASRSKNLYKITRDAPYRVVMTGTPISQGILDLYGLFEFLDPNIIGIGDFWSFKKRYAIMQDMKIHNRTIKKIVGYQNIEELMELIRPFTYQVTKEEAAKELPEKVYLRRYVEMTKEQASVYADIRKDRAAEIEKVKGENVMVVINHVLAAFTALQQIAGGYVSRWTEKYTNNGDEIREVIETVKPGNNPKVLEIKRIIDELDDREQVIIWCKYRHEVYMLEKELSDYKTEKFTKGSIAYLDKTKGERMAIQEDMDNKRVRYFISTPNSGGTGLTMNTVAYVVYYSNTQRLLFREQSEDRNHRIGQKRSVTYIDIIAERTVDDKILSSLKDKKELSDYVKTCLDSQEAPF